MHAPKRRICLPATLSLALCAAFAALPAAAADFPTGTYMASGVSMAFDCKGHYHVNINGTTMVEGDYSVNGKQITFDDNSGPWACNKIAAERSGTYDWQDNGSALTLRKLADPCEDRVKTLTPNAWKKQG